MATEKFSMAMGVQFDLAGKDTSANITPLLSMVYAFKLFTWRKRL
jgi:hypothetical protein